MKPKQNKKVVKEKEFSSFEEYQKAYSNKKEVESINADVDPYTYGLELASLALNKFKNALIAK